MEGHNNAYSPFKNEKIKENIKFEKKRRMWLDIFLNIKLLSGGIIYSNRQYTKYHRSSVEYQGCQRFDNI